MSQNSIPRNIQRQFFYYLAAASIGYVVDLGGLFVLHEFFDMYYLLAATVSFILGLTVVYVLSDLFVFGDSKIKNRSVEFGLFALIGVVGLGILAFFMWIFVDFVGLNYLLAKIVATIAVYLWNFFARRALYHN